MIGVIAHVVAAGCGDDAHAVSSDEDGGSTAASATSTTSTPSSTSIAGIDAAGGQTCLPWYDDEEAPRGYEHVGVCALPQ